MKPLSWDKQLGLVSPLKCAAIQSGQTKNPSKNEVGLDASHHAHTSPEGRGKYFFLDILSHRMSVMAIFRQPFEYLTELHRHSAAVVARFGEARLGWMITLDL